MSELLPYLPVFALAVSIGTLAYTIHNNRSSRYDDRFNAADLKIGIVAGKLDLVEDRVTIVENDLKHLPDKEVTHRLERSLLEMRGEMRGLTEQIKPIAAVSNRLQEAVFEKAGL